MDKLKTKVQNIDWWEIGYLVLYGAIFTYSFLDTTMFEIQWPPRFGYIFLIASGLFTVAKFIWNNTYTRKEMIWAAVIVISFVLSGIIADYSFLIWTGFLIVSAKDVDFDKILKVYLTIGITIMLAAFVASQMGWIENLQYVVWRDEQWVYRTSFGCVYPTDFAAHVFYIAIIGICLSEDKISWGKIINFVVLALIVLDECAARTSFICLMAMAMLLLVTKYLKAKLKSNGLYYVINMSIIVLAGLSIGLTHLYDTSKEWMIKINILLSERLAISKEAIETYGYKLFGQNIVESGLGRQEEFIEDYFFLDNSYIRIVLLYGAVLFIIVMFLFWLNGIKAIQHKRIIILCALIMIGVHGFMEHHILEVAYNPLLLLVFAKLGNLQIKGKLEDSNVS